MSFFVSKSLEGKFTEKDLLDNEAEAIYEDVKEDMYPISIKINDIFFEIKSLKESKFSIDLSYEGYKNFASLINKSENIDFYIFDNLLFSKKTKNVFVDSYERLTSSLIKLDIFIICQQENKNVKSK